MLQDSLIYRFFIWLKDIVVCYFINSKIYCLFSEVASATKTAKEASLFLRFYNKMNKLFGASWVSSVTAKAMNGLFELTNQISFVRSSRAFTLDRSNPTNRTDYIDEIDHTDKINYVDKTDLTDKINYMDEIKPIDSSNFENRAGKINFVDSSKIVSLVDRFFKSLGEIDCRTLGVMLLAFSSTGLVLQMLLNKYGKLFTLSELFLLVVAIILILIRRPLLSLYEGSWVAKKLAGFFKG